MHFCRFPLFTGPLITRVADLLSIGNPHAESRTRVIQSTGEEMSNSRSRRNVAPHSKQGIENIL